MRWLIDECVDAALAARLRRAGHDVVYMAEIAPAASDAAVLARAQQDSRLLLTEDKDFGDLVFRRGGPVPVAAAALIVAEAVGWARRALSAEARRAKAETGDPVLDSRLRGNERRECRAP